MLDAVVLGAAVGKSFACGVRHAGSANVAGSLVPQRIKADVNECAGADQAPGESANTEAHSEAAASHTHQLRSSDHTTHSQL